MFNKKVVNNLFTTFFIKQFIPTIENSLVLACYVLSSIRKFFNIIFCCLEILAYFLSCHPENQPVISPPL